MNRHDIPWAPSTLDLAQSQLNSILVESKMTSSLHHHVLNITKNTRERERERERERQRQRESLTTLPCVACKFKCNPTKLFFYLEKVGRGGLTKSHIINNQPNPIPNPSHPTNPLLLLLNLIRPYDDGALFVDVNVGLNKLLLLLPSHSYLFKNSYPPFSPPSYL